MRIKFVLNPKKKETPIQQTTITQRTNTYQCPYCDQILTLDGEIDDSTTLSCPQCHKDGLIIPTANGKGLKRSDKQKTIESPSSWLSQPDLRSKTVGILIIIIGFIMLINPTAINIKISITLFFIGSLLFTLIPEKRIMVETSKNTPRSFLQKNKLIISEKITLLIIIATVFLFLITNPADITIFLVLLYLCLLIIKELIDEFTPLYMKKRLNIFIMIFFVIFIIIIAERIITILDI